jgi:hypothetical protein
MTAQPAREIFLTWLSEVVDGALEPGSGPLWHYTNADGLKGIVTTDRLWATDTAFLNDSAELVYGVDLALGAIRAIAGQGVSASTARLMAALGEPDSGILRPFLDESLRLFVTCFCSNDDLLSQWRAYGGRGHAGGYAIGFQPPGPLPAWAQSAPRYLTLRKVIYDSAEQDRLATALVGPLVEYLEQDPGDDTRVEAVTRELVNGIAELAAWCKHPAFEEEQEWRLTYQPSDGAGKELPVLHRPADGLLVPYVELQVPRSVGERAEVLPIVSVRCGPSQDPDRKARGVRSLFEASGRYGDVAVVSSTAPARL